MRAGARVRLVSPDATDLLSGMAERGEIVWDKRRVEERDFDAHDFAVLAVDAAAEPVLSMARGRCLVDVCSDGSKGDFALAAQFEEDGCFVGVSSGGTDPARAAAVKKRIMEALPGKDTGKTVMLSRGSALALVQAREWAAALGRLGLSPEIRAVTSHGDSDRRSELSSFGFGAFVKALEDELLSGRGDCAVHSLKDMPSELPEGLVLAAALERGSRCDLLLTRDGAELETLPPGSRVGTSSVRRRAQVSRARPDLECVNCRGNIETRLEYLRRGKVDALVLAEAGLDRLGAAWPGSVRLPFVTAAGQGTLVLELRADSPHLELIRSLNHGPTWYEVTAERAFLKFFGLGCASPVGVSAVYADGELELRADMCDGSESVASERGRVSSDGDAREIAARLWERLRE
jgi:hydroxymethylbilane synthase